MNDQGQIKNFPTDEAAAKAGFKLALTEERAAELMKLPEKERLEALTPEEREQLAGVQKSIRVESAAVREQRLNRLANKKSKAISKRKMQKASRRRSRQ